MAPSSTEKQIKYEEELVEEAKKAKSQWHLPGFWDFLNATFLGDHYSWTWQPSSIIIIVASYYVYKYTEGIFEDRAVAYAAALWVPGIFWYWFVATFFYGLDTLSEEKGKAFKRRTAVPLSRILPVVFRNHFLTLLICPLATVLYYRHLAHNPVPVGTGDESVLLFLISYFVCGAVYEIIFFGGHFLEHLLPSWYRDYHLLHHTTKSDLSFSGYYMTWVDYCFEGLIPMGFCLVTCAHFNLSSVAVIATILLNITYAATVHSGWYLPGFPDPGFHWLHHSKVAPRGQGVNYGTHFDLMDLMFTTKEEYDSQKIGTKQ